MIGTERHESRRIDNQLRGRSGRQGDPGASHFFLSLEDDLMRIFGSDRMGGMLQKLGLKAGEAIVHPWINKALEKAQKKVEARNFDTRKNVLKYDDVMNDQRKEVYAQRKEFMKAADVSETVAEMRAEIIDAMVDRHIPEKAFAEQWETEGTGRGRARVLEPRSADRGVGPRGGHRRDRDPRAARQAAEQFMAAKAANMTPELMRFIEKSLLIQTLDAVWKEHLYALDHLRQGIGLRAYGQRDPLNEYKSEAFALFNAMLDELKERVTAMLSRVELAPEPAAGARIPAAAQQFIELHPEPAPAYGAERGCGHGGSGRDAGATAMRCATRVDPRGPGDMAEPRAMRRVRADRGRSSSIATGGWVKGCASANSAPPPPPAPPLLRSSRSGRMRVHRRAAAAARTAKTACRSPPR